MLQESTTNQPTAMAPMSVDNEATNIEDTYAGKFNSPDTIRG